MPHQPRDTAWKIILDNYFKEFVAFCLPDIYDLINWEKPYISLDKELQAISKDGVTGRRLTDKLFQVYLKNGEKRWILIHLEIQGESEEAFPQRMFIYAYRIFDKYQQPVLSCAILIDANPTWRPDNYEAGFGGSSLRLNYRVVKVLDYVGKEADLESSSNPFASVILSYLSILKVKNNPDIIRYKTKLDLTKRLYKKGYKKGEIINLYIFIDWLLHLPRDLEIEYNEAINRLEVAENMPYISSIQRLGREEGFQKGIHQGIQKGLEQGLERGIQKGLERGIQKGLEQGLERGIQKGLEQGLERGIRQMAKKLLTEGLLSVEEVVRLTGLTEKQVRALKNAVMVESE